MRKFQHDRFARLERLAAKRPGAHQRRVEWEAYEAKMREREEDRAYALESRLDEICWASFEEESGEDEESQT